MVNRLFMLALHAVYLAKGRVSPDNGTRASSITIVPAGKKLFNPEYFLKFKNSLGKKAGFYIRHPEVIMRVFIISVNRDCFFKVPYRVPVHLSGHKRAPKVAVPSDLKRGFHHNVGPEFYLPLPYGVAPEGCDGKNNDENSENKQR